MKRFSILFALICLIFNLQTINELSAQCSVPNPEPEKEIADIGATPIKNGDLLSKEGNKAGERIVITVNDVEVAFRWCPPGTFMMGSPESEEERGYDETQHSVTLTKGFWMMETEVTVGMFKAFVNETGYESQGDDPVFFVSENYWLADTKMSWKNPHYKQDDNCPVTCVSLNDSIAFCKWLSAKTGRKILLPTEAQWEYACRAGSTTAFFWGNVLNGDKANCDGNYPYGTKQKGKFLDKAMPVRSYSPNAWGLYDMHGNAWERCSDWYGAYPDYSVTDPEGPKNGIYTVNRGGGWNRFAEYSRSSYRDKDEPQVRIHNLGFRCVAVVQTAKAAQSANMANKLNKPTENKVGKLYALSVWGTNASDLHDSLEELQHRYGYAMEAGGLNLNSKSDPDKFVKEFTTLSGDNASKKRLLETCRSIGKRAQKNDVIFVYMCCHGITKRIDGDNKRHHILFPGIKTVDQMQNIKEYGILRSEILEALNPDNHRLVVLITDSGTRENDEQVIKRPGDPDVFACYDPGYLRRPPAEENPLRIFLRTNAGLVDWNSTSPFGGKDGLGEQSPIYRFAQVHEGLFFANFMMFTLDDKKSISTSKFFNELKSRLASSFEFSAKDEELKNSNLIFSNQSTQTLFDFEGRGYVEDRKK